MPIEIVVLHDDALHVRLLQRALTKRVADARVAGFVDPSVAFRAVLERPPAVVITEQEMPICSGVEFARALRHALANRCPRVVLVSGTRIQRSDLRVFDAYLRKPYRLDFLVEGLRPWFGSAASR